jgi:hypothetical protein
MGALNRTCTCCRNRVHVALIHDTKVKAPVCLTCYAKRAKERRSYPAHISRGLPPKSQRMIEL